MWLAIDEVVNGLDADASYSSFVFELALVAVGVVAVDDVAIQQNWTENKKKTVLFNKKYIESKCEMFYLRCRTLRRPYKRRWRLHLLNVH